MGMPPLYLCTHKLPTTADWNLKELKMMASIAAGQISTRVQGQSSASATLEPWKDSATLSLQGMQTSAETTLGRCRSTPGLKTL